MRSIFPACVTVLQLGTDYDDAIAYVLFALQNVVVEGGTAYVEALIGSGVVPLIVKALSSKQVCVLAPGTPVHVNVVLHLCTTLALTLASICCYRTTWSLLPLKSSQSL